MFGVQTYQFVAAQQTIPVKFPELFFRFETEERVLMFNKSEITGESGCNGNLFESEDKHE